MSDRFVRAVGPHGRDTTLEVDQRCVEVARRNFERADVADRIDLNLGPAVQTVQGLIDSGAQPYDVIFIDADKPNNPVYLAAALQLSKPGTVIIGDNVVRNGAVRRSGAVRAVCTGETASVINGPVKISLCCFGSSRGSTMPELW
jgi:predicted O-methyltransferase YrrM